ncbi:hypothetical protein SO802_007983 [Lithocarpus litseifolius]|uniref:Uncharacterized protein n=1 Tax=Lithocarpus litseifolius TaxID=425828 RepID=A0AAW2DU82_9ROSI
MPNDLRWHNFRLKITQNVIMLVEEVDQLRSPKINVVHIRVSPSDAKSSKNKKRKVAEDNEIGNVISQSFDNVSMSIDKTTEVMAKCFSKLYGAEVHIALGLLDLDPILKTEAYIFLMKNPLSKEIFFGCPDDERKDILLTLISRSKN